MMEQAFQFIFNQITKAFAWIDSWEIINGMSFLDFFVIILIITILLKIFVPRAEEK